MEELNFNNINKHIAKVFKNHRKKNNYTQEKVAELTGLSAKYVSQLERGISGGTLETILKFCNIYNITPNSLLEPFLNSNIKNTSNEFLDKFNSLCARDQKAVMNLIEYFFND